MWLLAPLLDSCVLRRCSVKIVLFSFKTLFLVLAMSRVQTRPRGWLICHYTVFRIMTPLVLSQVGWLIISKERLIQAFLRMLLGKKSPKKEEPQSRRTQPEGTLFTSACSHPLEAQKHPPVLDSCWGSSVSGRGELSWWTLGCNYYFVSSGTCQLEKLGKNSIINRFDWLLKKMASVHFRRFTSSLIKSTNDTPG